MSSLGRDGYVSKMNSVLTEATNKWWNELTKEEIIAYLSDCPDITADVLRTMLRNEETHLTIGSSFDTTTQVAAASFFNRETEE